MRSRPRVREEVKIHLSLLDGHATTILHIAVRNRRFEGQPRDVKKKYPRIPNVDH
jgi:hypothetical protein